MSAIILMASEIEAAFPRTWGKLVGLGAFDGPRLACRHVIDGQDGLVCVQHPGAGVSCLECTTTHVDRHDPAAEMTCDECAAGVPTISGLAIECRPRPLTVFDTRGRSRRRSMAVYIIGAGICEPCGSWLIPAA